MVDETRVRYKAIADFTSLARSIRTAKRNLKELREEEAKGNAQSATGANKAAAANDRRAASLLRLSKAAEAQNKVLANSTVQFIVQSKAAREYADAQNDAAKAATKNASATQSAIKTISQGAQATRSSARATKEAVTEARNLEGVTRRAHRATQQSIVSTGENEKRLRRLGDTYRRNKQEVGGLLGAVDKLNTSFRRLGNWRPHLTPPFIALIPIIAGLLGLINPLVAGLGAVGAAAFGFAASLGSVAGAALAVVPALGTLLSMVFALKTAFGGIGGAFKAFSAMKKATNPTTAKAELTQQEEITRAQERYARSIQDTAWAQEDLDEARKGYILRLRELQKAVDRAAMSEARAAANAQLARENYANVLADPGSTKGQKMEAKVGVDEAQAEFKDVVDENKQNVADLNEMKKKGIEGDREVIRAQRALTDAIWAQRDAQLALTNAQNGSDAGAAATAINEYQAALDKLSPSARKFVETILAMSDAWSALKKRVQERFFEKFVDNVDRLRLLFGPLEVLLGTAADSLGRFVDNFLLLITSPEWQNDLTIFGKDNGPIIDALGEGLLDVLDAFKDIALVAQNVLLLPMAETFRDWAAGFQEWVETGRQSGGLQDYLEKVRERLAQWWRIVKNIGKTLFNYGSAASEFADWITTGFEKTTEGWLESSETALGPNSKFKQYLEDIKPLVSEIKGLFADFFGWFARVSADPKNIGQMTEILSLIRDELGPAISTLLQQFADAEIGPKFIDAVSRIVEIITILTNSPAVDVFFTVLNFLLDVAKWIVANPILGTLLMSIATGFAAIAAVSLVSKFTGLTALINLLLNFAKGGKGLPGLLRGIAAAFGIMVPVAGTAAGAAGTAAAAGTRRGPGGGGLGAAPAIPAPLPGQTRAGYRAAQAAGSKGGFNLLSSIGKGAVKGVGVAAIATIAAQIIGDVVAGSAAKGDSGAGQRVGGGLLAGIGSGAGIGALLGNIIPIPGVGAGIGAAVGAVAGGATALATASPEDREVMFQEMGNFFSDLFEQMGNFFRDVGGWIGDAATAFWEWLTIDIPAWVDSVVDGFFTWLTVDIPNWLGSVAQGFYTWLTVDLPFQLGVIVGAFLAWLTIDMPAWLAGVWEGFMTWLTVDMPAWLESVWTGFMTWLTVDLPAWLAAVAQGFWTWLTVDLPRWLGQVAQGFWRWLTVDLPGWLGQAAGKFWHWLTVELPNAIGIAASKFWTWLTVDLPKGVVDAGKAIGDGFTSFFKDFFSNTGKFFKGVADAWNDFWGGIFGWFGAGVEEGSGGRIGDVPGGISGPTAKRVQKMLPAGMSFSSGYRTPAENKAAGGSATSLHMDRNNPAVDVIGTRTQMNGFARLLGAVGGWRQLYYNNITAPGVGHWPGHEDHIHVARNGGQVPGRGNGDTVPSMLTPGEFVVKKSIVNRVGADNLARFNAGVMSFADLLRQSMNQPGKQKQAGGGMDGISFLAAGGLVPSMPGNSFPFQPPGPPPAAGGGGTGYGGAPVIAGDLIINNPTPEPASDSLPRSIRNVAYLGGRR